MTEIPLSLPYGRRATAESHSLLAGLLHGAVLGLFGWVALGWALLLLLG